MQPSSTRQRGFTLLIAALVASIVLSFASAIFDIAQKQVALASLSQQSQYAFYAADTGAECALYWDVRFAYFMQTTPVLTPPPICDGTPLVFTPPSGGQPYAYPYTFSFQFAPNGYCAQITVQKCQGTISGGGVCTTQAGGSISTQIRAYGYNTSCATTGTSPVALQRSVELNY